MISYYDFRKNNILLEMEQDLMAFPKAYELLKLELNKNLIPIKEPNNVPELFINTFYEAINDHLKPEIKLFTESKYRKLTRLVEWHNQNTQLLLEDQVDMKSIVANINADFDAFIKEIEAIDPTYLFDQIKTAINTFVGGGSTPTQPAATSNPSPVNSPAAPTVNVSSSAKTPTANTSSGHKFGTPSKGMFRPSVTDDEDGGPITPTAAKKSASGGWWNDKVKPVLNGMGNMFLKYPMHKLKKMYQGAKNIWGGKFENVNEAVLLAEMSVTNLYFKIKNLIDDFRNALIKKVKENKDKIINNMLKSTSSPTVASTATSQPAVTPPSPSPNNPTIPQSVTTASSATNNPTTSTNPTANAPSIDPAKTAVPPLGPDLAVKKRGLSPESKSSSNSKKNIAAYLRIKFLSELPDEELIKNSNKIFNSGSGLNMSMQYSDLAKKFRMGVANKDFAPFREALNKKLEEIKTLQPKDIENAEKEYPKYVEVLKKVLDKTPEHQSNGVKPPEAPENLKKPIPPEAPVEKKVEPETPAPTEPVAKPEEVKPPEEAVKEKPSNQGRDEIETELKTLLNTGEDMRALIFNKVLDGNKSQQIRNAEPDDRASFFAQFFKNGMDIQNPELADKITDAIQNSPAVKDLLTNGSILMTRNAIASGIQEKIQDILSSLYFDMYPNAS